MTSSRVSDLGRKVLSLVSAMMFSGLAGCSALPAQGPGTSDVTAAAGSATAEQAGYLVANLDARTTQILASRSDVGFRGRFGDYRPAPDQTIGVGDTIGVTIWEASAGGLFSAPVVDRSSPGSRSAVIPDQVVARDGSITVPYAGRIRVAGLTPPMVEDKIVKALAGKAIEPQALVAINKNLANTATVSGGAVSGARVPLSPRGDRVLDVLASAGGVHTPAHESFITLTRDGHAVTVPMQIVLRDPKENVFVRSGDTITVEQAPQSFTAFGATGRNAVINFDAVGITLDQAIAKAGGLIEFQSDPQGVFLFRREPATVVRQIDPSFELSPDRQMVEVVYRINMRDPNTYFLASRIKMRDHDIVYVAASPYTDLQKIFAVVSPTLSTVGVARSLAQ